MVFKNFHTALILRVVALNLTIVACLVLAFGGLVVARESRSPVVSRSSG